MSTAFAPIHTQPATATVDVAELSAAIAGGALVVDIRTAQQREEQGVLTGAVAIEAATATALLDPFGRSSLTALAVASEIVLVSSDGVDAVLLAWELQVRGAGRNAAGPTVRALHGGFGALLAAGGVRILATAPHVHRESAAISAH